MTTSKRHTISPRPAAAPTGRDFGRQRGRHTGWLLLGGLVGMAIALVVLFALAINEQAATTVNTDADTISVDTPQIDLGRVPLNVNVPVTVQVTNRSERTVLLGRATAEALEGC
ncbi:MAG: hypothetical protein HY332_02280 [Chloroflexi bacterium]|nr:hypothetical protein [Chloroflexota bacterium]